MEGVVLMQLTIFNKLLMGVILLQVIVIVTMAM